MAKKSLFSVDEFCDEYSLSRCYAYREMKAGRLIFKKMSGGRTMITQEQAEAWKNALPDGVLG
jgi:predicted site-specific integrase-resolvase